VQEGASPESELVRRGVSNYTLCDLREDAAKGELPQVSWVVAPYQYSEHPKASPTDGAYYISLVLDALTANPEVWSKTVLLINYDENDGLFDHIVPPMPPRSSAAGGHGMVSADLRDSLPDEFVDRDKYPNHLQPLIPGADPGGLQPIGLGPRVPMLVISPWSSGGWVCSEVFDHTSVLRFLEKRFGVEEPNISKWRRTICGDLTSAFDFSSVPQDVRTRFQVPSPIQSRHQQYSILARQNMPEQEAGTRPARPLPYLLRTHCRVEHDRVWIELINEGSSGAAFYIYDALHPDTAPRRYSVSAGDTLSDFWLGGTDGQYDLAVYGPNGYVAHQRGKISLLEPQVTLSCEATPKAVKISIQNPEHQVMGFSVAEIYTNYVNKTMSVSESQEIAIPVAASSGWFDVSVTLNDSGSYLRRFSGHVEDGKSSTSDPGPLG
jgi:phospholipase C